MYGRETTDKERTGGRGGEGDGAAELLGDHATEEVVGDLHSAGGVDVVVLQLPVQRNVGEQLQHLHNTHAHTSTLTSAMPSHE